MSDKTVVHCLGFLTVLPIPVKGELRPADMGKAMAFFPVAGAVIGEYWYVQISCHRPYCPVLL